MRVGDIVELEQKIPWHSEIMVLFEVVGDSIFVENCSWSLSVVFSSYIGFTELLVITDEEILLAKADVELSTSVLEDFVNSVEVHLSVNVGGIVLGTSIIGVLESELLLCQNSVKLEDDATVGNEPLFLSLSVVVDSSVVLPTDAVTSG